MTNQKTQVVMIHGWMTFKNNNDYISYLKNRDVSIEKYVSWAGEYVDRELGERFYTIKPTMPSKENSKYDEWKINFEKYIPYLKDDLVLIWWSLWWIFLAKYLSENKFPKKILSVYLLCPPFDDTLIGEDLVWWFVLKDDLSFIYENTDNLTLMFSEDDDVVPISHADKYAKKLNKAKIEIYKSKNWHFNISEFPELIEMIKHDVKNK